MQLGHLLDQCKTVRSINATAAGTTTINGTGAVMDGYNAVRALGLFGALTATQTTSLKLQQSNDDGSTDPYADITGSQTANMADADSNKLLISDVIRPTKRYVRAVVVRGTANAVIDGVVLEFYKAAGPIPITQDATVSKSVKV